MDHVAETAARDTPGSTPLYVAVFWNDKSTIEALPGSGAAIEAVEYTKGWTALHTALVRLEAAISLMEVLLQRGADLNAQDGGPEMTKSKGLLWTIVVLLIFSTALACGEEPTDREVDEKEDLVAEKLAASVLLYGFGSPGKCRDILDKYEDDIEQAVEKVDEYNGDSNRKTMSLLENVEKQLDKMGEELETEGCL